MKKFLFILAMSTMTYCSVWGQDDHKRMLKEGRTWEMMWVIQTWAVDKVLENVGVVEMEEVNIMTHVTYTVTGEAVVEGRPCYCISRSNFTSEVQPERYFNDVEIPKTTELFYMYEDDGKVYSYTPEFNDEWQLEFDDTLLPGGALSGENVVEKIETVLVKGTEYRRFIFRNGLCWVEGIGSSMTGMVNNIAAIMSTDNTVVKMNTISVYDVDRCIFESEDFAVGVSSAVIPLVQPVDNNINAPVFDLQGRRVTGQPRRGVYIQNGRKRVVKD